MDANGNNEPFTGEVGEEIREGQIYETVEAAKECVNQYNRRKFQNFVVNNNNKKSLEFVCKYSVHRESDSKGKREHLHYNFMGCKAKIRLYKSLKEGKLKVTILDLEHNHPSSQEIYENEHANFTDEEKDLMLTLKAANAKPSHIKRVLLEHSKKKSHITEIEKCSEEDFT